MIDQKEWQRIAGEKTESKKYILVAAVLAGILCITAAAMAEDTVRKIVLGSGTAALDGEAVPEYDYTWHADPGTAHPEARRCRF